MISTFQALLVALIAVLPGALYTIAREHRNAAWARGDTGSRLIGFLGVSAFFQALYAPLTYWVYVHDIATGWVAMGKPIEWFWWPILLAYVAVPYLVGALTANTRRWNAKSGRIKRAIKAVVRLFTDQAPEPRAWDMVFSRPDLVDWVRIKMKDGTWRAGLRNRQPDTKYPSYASGYSEPQELYLSDQAVINQLGEFVTDEGSPQLTGWSLLIRWEEISVLELLEDRSDDNREQDRPPIARPTPLLRERADRRGMRRRHGSTRTRTCLGGDDADDVLAPLARCQRPHAQGCRGDAQPRSWIYCGRTADGSLKNTF